MVDTPKSIAESQAALSMFESLLIAMCDLEVMSETDARKVLAEAAAPHQQASLGSDNPELHKDVAKIIEHMMVGHSPTRGYW
jgi:hypothetical protein